MLAERRGRIALGCVVLLGSCSYVERESLAPLACAGDHACAAARAKALGDAPMPTKSFGLADQAYDLCEALERDECEEAAGPAGSIRSTREHLRDERVDDLASRALLAYEAYCFIPFPETSASCAGNLACARDRVEVLSARVEASKGDSSLSRFTRALRASLQENDCPAAADVARALRRLAVATTVPPKIARALERAVEGVSGYCGDKPGPPVAAPPEDAVISLVRTPCPRAVQRPPSSCPSYRLTVQADGRVTLLGDVANGEYTIAPERARMLFDSFESMRFASRPPSFPPVLGDEGPGYELALHRGKVEFSATAGSACRLDDPAVCFLTLEVDELAAPPGRR